MKTECDIYMAGSGEAPKPVKLQRTLGLWNLVIIGLVIIQPTAPMGIYGVISNKANGHVVTTILLAMVAMLFTAICYGRMSQVYPSAGSAFTYVGKEIHPVLGYVTGWSMLMDYILNPLICVAFCAKAAINLFPFCSYYIWVVIFMAAFTAANLLGIKASTRVNQAMCAGLLVVVVLFVVMALRWILHNLQHPWPALLIEPFYNRSTFQTSSILGGTSVAALTYIGFDGISTLSEEAHNPRKNILRATVLVCLITGFLSSIEVYTAQLVWGAQVFPSSQIESAFAMIARRLGGVVLFQIINCALLVANAGSGMGAQLAAARLLYSMARSGALPAQFGVLEKRNRIPQNAVLSVGAFALLGAIGLEFVAHQLGGGAYEIGAQIVNFGAFIAFMGVNAAELLRSWRCSRRDRKNMAGCVVPFCGLTICAFVWTHLNRVAFALGTVWMLIGIICYLIRKQTHNAESFTFAISEE